MRFSTAHLLLVVPAFFLGTLAASVILPHSPIRYKFWDAYRDTRIVESWIVDIERETKGLNIPADEINAWLAGRIDVLHADARYVNDYPGRDPWGNHYRCLRNVALANGQVHSIGIYSLGRDGISRTHGHDLDDLNSWDEDSNRFYVEELRSRKRESLAVAGALLAPIVYFVLLACGWLIRRAWRFEPKRLSQGPIVPSRLGDVSSTPVPRHVRLTAR